jgi:hypothetical protein
MPYVRFEPTIPASERAKTVHAVDRSATVSGAIKHDLIKDSTIILTSLSIQLHSVVGIATGYGLNGRGFGVGVPVGARIVISPYSPDWLLGPPNVLTNG